MPVQRTAIALAVAAGLSLCSGAGAVAAPLPAEGSGVAAPELSAGPFITDAGLVWDGPAGIMLTRPGGRTTVLDPAAGQQGAVTPDWLGADWWATASPDAVYAGRIGGPLSAAPLLQRCRPQTGTEPALGSHAEARDKAGLTLAVSGEHLYAAMPPGCPASAASAPYGTLVALDLRTGRWRVLAAFAAQPVSVAAAGEFVALAYWHASSPQQGTLSVALLQSSSGRQIDEMAPPASTAQTGLGYESSVQVDSLGDVLVNTGGGGPPTASAVAAQPPPPLSLWWWADEHATVGQALSGLGQIAELSDGRVAFFSVTGAGFEQAIDITDLSTGATDPVVAFAGSAGPIAFSLSGNGLAWSQQSTVTDVVIQQLPGGIRSESCTPVALTGVQLASVDLRDAPTSPIVAQGAPIPPQYAHEPPCIEA